MSEFTESLKKGIHETNIVYDGRGVGKQHLFVTILC